MPQEHRRISVNPTLVVSQYETGTNVHENKKVFVLVPKDSKDPTSDDSLLFALDPCARTTSVRLKANGKSENNVAPSNNLVVFKIRHLYFKNL